MITQLTSNKDIAIALRQKLLYLGLYSKIIQAPLYFVICGNVSDFKLTNVRKLSRGIYYTANIDIVEPIAA